MWNRLLPMILACRICLTPWCLRFLFCLLRFCFWAFFHFLLSSLSSLSHWSPVSVLVSPSWARPAPPSRRSCLLPALFSHFLKNECFCFCLPCSPFEACHWFAIFSAFHSSHSRFKSFFAPHYFSWKRFFFVHFLSLPPVARRRVFLLPFFLCVQSLFFKCWAYCLQLGCYPLRF